MATSSSLIMFKTCLGFQVEGPCLLLEHLQQSPNNPFSKTGIVRCLHSSFRIIGGVAFAVSQYSCPQYNKILGEHEGSLYLRRERVKYWDIPIVIGEWESVGDALTLSL